MSEDSLPLRRIVRRSEVAEEGMPLTLEADAPARVSLAERLGIRGVEAFTAEMTFAPWRRDGLVVRGRIHAEVVQTCVVTLEPVHNTVRESFEDYYAPDPAAVSEGEPDGPEPGDVEPLIDQRIDAGALAIEHLVLALDPYPRCADAEFDPGCESEEREKSGPFAALATLRKSPH